MSRFGPLLVGAVLLLTSCSLASPGSPKSGSPNPERTNAVSAQPTDAQISKLIRSLPGGKSRDDLAIHFRAIDEAASHSEPITIDYTTGPTADQSKVAKVVAKFSEKLKVFQLLGLASLNQDWVIASEKDYEWWVDYRSAQDPKFPVDMWNEKSNELGHCRLGPDVLCGAGNEVRGKNYQDNVVGTRFSDRGLEYISRHEATHFYQAVFGYGGLCWMAEGQATFFETYLESSSRTRSEILSRLRESPAGLAQLSESKLLRLISRDEVCQGDSNIAYDLGLLGFEYLYSNFSFLDVHKLQVLSSKKSWGKAVIEVLELDAKGLNRELASYIFTELHQD